MRSNCGWNVFQCFVGGLLMTVCGHWQPLATTHLTCANNWFEVWDAFSFVWSIMSVWEWMTQENTISLAQDRGAIFLASHQSEILHSLISGYVAPIFLSFLFWPHTRGFLKKVTFYLMDILKEVLSPPTIYCLLSPFLIFDVKLSYCRIDKNSVFFYLGCREVEFMHVHINLSFLIDSLSEVLASVLKSIRNH